MDAPIGRDVHNRKQMAVTHSDKGRQAQSEYSTLESFPNHTLLEVRPLTGRTHQIRLHMAFLGCPVSGDRVYGHRKSSVPLDRQFLHAYRLSIQIPGEKEPRTFEAPLPGELEVVLNELRSRQHPSQP